MFSGQKLDRKDCSGKNSISILGKFALWKTATRKDYDCRRAVRSQSEPFETKINEDKKKYLTAGPKRQPSPDYNDRTYGNSVWWRNLKCGDLSLVDLIT